MAINEQFPRDHLMLNPETANFQNFIDPALNNTKPIIDLSPLVDSVVQKAKNVWEDIKTNAQENQNDSLRVAGGNLEYNTEPIINFSPAVENFVQGVKNVWEDIKTNAQQNQNNYDILNTALEQPIYETIATNDYPTLDIINPLSLKEDIENSRIHEELAEKTKQISKIEARIKKLEKNPFLNWFPRALDDSNDEKIF